MCYMRIYSGWKNEFPLNYFVGKRFSKGTLSLDAFMHLCELKNVRIGVLHREEAMVSVLQSKE